jgi:hypothetical protein
VLVFFASLIGFLGTFLLIEGGLTYILVTIVHRRPGPLHLVVGVLCGYLSGALFIWTVVHREEGIGLLMMAGAVIGAVVSGLVATNSARLLQRRRVTRNVRR